MAEQRLPTDKIYDHVRRWHGFTDHIDALKALVWLGGLLVAGVIFGLDQRYAGKEIESVAVSTWEIIILDRLEKATQTLCRGDISEGYRKELHSRVQELVAEYIERKGSSPYIPSCREALPNPNQPPR